MAQQPPTSSGVAAPSTFLDAVAPIVSYGLVDALTENPEAAANMPNREVRQVTSGHFVSVTPTPLSLPRYVAHSSDFVRTAFDGRVTDDMAQSDQFLRFFSGDLAGAVKSAAAPETATKIRKDGWATGYALSMMGQEFYDQCPYRNGNGYGDGRAISVLEVTSAESGPWEFQLKGGGPTPYCRGADGRAVLRSSIREFLVSEAMHHLGVATTRGSSLVVSKADSVKRPWYSETSQRAQPDVMVGEHCAIATRCAPSFIRVGQLELFARRARKNEHSRALKELADIVAHAIAREYPELGAVPTPLNADGTKTTPQFLDKVVDFVIAFRERLTTLIANWIRVGFCQGNFNADNCAIGGRTLDYGPFGFCQIFDPDFQPWSGGGKHYAFFGQPSSAMANFSMVCRSMQPLIAACDDAEKIAAFDRRVEETLSDFSRVMSPKVHDMFARKLGLNQIDGEVFGTLMRVLSAAPMDYTIFFRELCLDGKGIAKDAAHLVERAFYADAADDDDEGSAKQELSRELTAWLPTWHAALSAQHGDGFDEAAVVQQMRKTNPKYIPREWMLAEAYRAAIDNVDYEPLRELQQLFTDPYGLAPTTVADAEERFYRLAPTEALSKGGVAVMT